MGDYFSLRASNPPGESLISRSAASISYSFFIVLDSWKYLPMTASTLCRDPGWMSLFMFKCLDLRVPCFMRLSLIILKVEIELDLRKF